MPLCVFCFVTASPTFAYGHPLQKTAFTGTWSIPITVKIYGRGSAICLLGSARSFRGWVSPSFPNAWQNYLAATQGLASVTEIKELVCGIFSLLLSIPSAFADGWLRPTIGLILILSVSLHISLSWADVKNSLSAFPLYGALTALFALVTSLFGLEGAIVSWLSLLNLRTLALFAVVIAFAAVWVLIGVLVRLIRLIVSWF